MLFLPYPEMELEIFTFSHKFYLLCGYSTAGCETDSVNIFIAAPLAGLILLCSCFTSALSKICLIGVNLETHARVQFGPWHNIMQTKHSWMYVSAKAFYVSINLQLQERALFWGKQMELHKNYCKQFLQYWKCQLLCIQCTSTPTGISLDWCFP